MLAIARDLVGLAGVGFVSYGAYQYSHPAGFITLGVLLLVGARLLSRGT